MSWRTSACRTGVLMLLALSVGVGSCTTDPPKSVEDTPGAGPEIVEVYGQPNSRQLELAIGSCNQDPQVAVVEASREVKLRAVAEVPVDSDDCQDNALVTLNDPLGDRTVIDDRAGEELEVLPPD